MWITLRKPIDTSSCTVYNYVYQTDADKWQKLLEKRKKIKYNIHITTGNRLMRNGNSEKGFAGQAK